jgi:2-dehydro-3-deoxyphosphogluconate aldolase/(4S)-4-hydroxy-2-oxoglutarate aldolase
MTGLTADGLADLLGSAVVLPVLRAADPDTALQQVRRAVAADVPVVELTTTIPDWTRVVREVRATWPALIVGVGTVLEVGHAQAAVEAGAAFLVSPCPVPHVRAAVTGGPTLIEGGFTPRELLEAASRGLAKFFPAHVGGPAMLASVLAVAPGARIVPTGGIAIDDTASWLKAGALAVGVGAGLLDEPDLAARLRALRRT